MAKKLTGVLFLLLQFILSDQESYFQVCDGIENRIQEFSVDVSDCNAGEICVVPVGTPLYIKTNFVPGDTIRGLKSRVSSKMGVLVVPKGPNRSVCPNAISEEADRCDKAEGLVKGRHYAYIEEFPVRLQYRDMQIRVRLEFFIGHRPFRNNTLLCYEVSLKVTSDS
ncbi:hypothetical protein AVEN_225944-1 [Araneus ventricosus]|uniref:MD-2-related lipid-recognition domain-containing protein n=1 Tax=Araneus ventricosus TaxID=182803 RepID=A0A4Y2GRL7_ARAVE|nr:hypothetical protein AVEN_225944-1 [Araneus ventricosus]